MITRLEATRYRCFERLAIDTGSYQVVVGANGSGKSTLLDLPLLLGDLLQQRQVADAFLRRRGSRAPRATTLEELIYRQRGTDFVFAVEARLPEPITACLNDGHSEPAGGPGVPDHVRYEMRLRVDRQRSLTVESEYLVAFPMTEAYVAGRLPVRGDNVEAAGWIRILERSDGGPAVFTRETDRFRKVEAPVEASRLALPRVVFESEQDYPAARWFHDLLTEGAVIFSPVWNDLHVASPPGAPPVLIGSGENLPWLALELKETNPDLFADWVTHVAEALPIRAIDVAEREEDHHAYFSVEYRNGLVATSSGLSEGTLRLLAYTFLAYLPHPPALVMVEEPENGIHPRAVETVLQSLESMYDSQVWVASHSPVVLAHTDLDHVLCARLSSEGAAEVVPGRAHPRLADWQGRIDLGSLFAAGVLG